MHDDPKVNIVSGESVKCSSSATHIECLQRRIRARSSLQGASRGITLTTWEFIGRDVDLRFRACQRRQLTTTTMASRIALNTIRASGMSLRSFISLLLTSYSHSVACTTSCGRPANPLCVRLFLPARTSHDIHRKSTAKGALLVYKLHCPFFPPATSLRITHGK